MFPERSDCSEYMISMAIFVQLKVDLVGRQIC